MMLPPDGRVIDLLAAPSLQAEVMCASVAGVPCAGVSCADIPCTGASCADVPCTGVSHASASCGGVACDGILAMVSQSGTVR